MQSCWMYVSVDDSKRVQMRNRRCKLSKQAQCVKHASWCLAELLPCADVIRCFAPERNRVYIFQHFNLKNVQKVWVASLFEALKSFITWLDMLTLIDSGHVH